MLRRADLRSPVVAAFAGKERAVILLLSVVCIVYLCFSGLCVFQRLRLSLCTCGAVRLSVLVFVLAGPCGFVGRLPHSVILGQDVVLFLEARRKVRWRVESYQQADVRYRILVLLQQIGCIG